MQTERTVLGGRYELDRLIGKGGMADVYVASDRVLNRLVAVKILARSSPGTRPSSSASSARRGRRPRSTTRTW